MPLDYLVEVRIRLAVAYDVYTLHERLCNEPPQHLPYGLYEVYDGNVSGSCYIYATFVHLTLTHGRIAATFRTYRGITLT